MPIIACLDPEAPVMDCRNTNIFGAPRGTLGRNNVPITGIAVHCIRDSYDGYLAKACVGKTRQTVGCHASFHYVIDAETGMISSLVPEDDLAWAWQSYRTNFPPTTPLDCCQCPPPCPAPPCPDDECVAVTYTGWPVLSALFPNLAADFYTINIGVTGPNRPEQSLLDGVNCCTGPYGLSAVAYRNLVQLLAWIEFRYVAVTVDREHIAFHDEIVTTDDECLECACGANGSCLVCDVSSYCQRCRNAADPTVTISDTLAYVYGENASGCRIKISLEDFIALLGP